MAQTIPNPEPAGARPAPHLDCERLDCYRVAVEFQMLAARLVASRRVGATLRDQLDRASISIVLCIAEGAGRRFARVRSRRLGSVCQTLQSWLEGSAPAALQFLPRWTASGRSNGSASLSGCRARSRTVSESKRLPSMALTSAPMMKMIEDM